MIVFSVFLLVDDDVIGCKNMQQLIQLCWIVVFGQVGIILVVYFVFGIELLLVYMVVVLVGLVVFNGVSLLCLWLSWLVSNGELFVVLFVDVVILSMQLYFSGGVINFFIFFYFLQVVLVVVLLEVWFIWIILLIIVVCFVVLEFVVWLLLLLFDYEFGLFSLYIQGMLLCFVFNVVLLVIFINCIICNWCDWDVCLVVLCQCVVEEEYIVCMGLLVFGVVYELGMLLVILVVILGDWWCMLVFCFDFDLVQEIGEMQIQVLCCKFIVSGILLFVGEVCGEVLEDIIVYVFVDELVVEWCVIWLVNDFEY